MRSRYEAIQLVGLIGVVLVDALHRYLLKPLQILVSHLAYESVAPGLQALAYMGERRS